MVFDDRYHAGVLLGEKLQDFVGRKNILVLGIPRGGIVVAKAVADTLRLPIEAIVAKKIGAPNQEEMAIGAVGPDGATLLDHRMITELSIDSSYIEKRAIEISNRVVEKVLKFGKRNKSDFKNKTVILADDGIATGATIEVAIKYLKAKNVKRIVLAVPVAPKASVKKFTKLVDKCIVLEIPFNFNSVGQFYKSFPQVTDDEVVYLLRN
jgi:putative phosphoribosyl transferase